MRERVKIKGWMKCPYKIKDDKYIEVPEIWYSPEQQYAVLELFKKEVYVAVKVDNIDENGLICSYVDRYEDWDCCGDLKSYSVEWWLKYGFAKLHCSAMESGFDGTIKRFYFDKKLYLKKCREENWFLLGDIHGDSSPIEYFYHQNKERLQLDECRNNMILLGDVGANISITGERDSHFKEKLSKFPFTYICLRGNHEARVTDVIQKYPEKWKRINKYGGTIYVEKEFPHMEYLEDIPAVYKFGGYKTLSLPGAYSVDKEYRLMHGWPWFSNEQLSEEEMQHGRKLIKEQNPFELVISHTCPIAFEPRDLFLSNIEQSQVDKTMEKYLGEIEETIEYKRWAWGHFHADRLYPWDGEKEKLMLLNEKVVDLKKFMKMKKTDYWADILA